MKSVLVLAMHGTPPGDLPAQEVGELFRLHSRLEQATGAERAALQQRHDALDTRIRAWPRTVANDPFYFGSLELAEALSRVTGCEVIVGFNEFCAPTLAEAIEQAVQHQAQRVVVLTPMMTRGGGHSEHDIPAAVRRAQASHPAVAIVYAWPFDTAAVAAFLGTQVQRWLQPEPLRGPALAYPLTSAQA